MYTPESFFWIQSPLCRKVPAAEVLPGDLGFVPAKHLFLVLGSGTAFEKDCYEKKCPYQIRPIPAILGDWETPSVKVEYYRCTDTAPLKERYSAQLGEPFLSLEAQVAALEVRALREVRARLEPQPLAHAQTREVRLGILDQVARLESSVKAAAPASEVDEVEFLWRTLKVRLEGIRQQIFHYSLIHSDGKVS
jgi:hypothetical protein